MNLLTRLRRGEPEISRLSFNDVIQLIAQKTSPFGVMNGPVTYTGRRPSERVENSFRGYINGAYKVNPIVFGIMTKRASVLSEARFAWREKVAGKPGDIYYDDALSVLENPWPNGTTGELIARMIQDVDLAGNCYIVNEGDRLRRLRPDWVQIVLTGDPLKDLDVDVYGYLYTAGGPDSGGESKAYLPSEMCHWSPSPDPDALYRGMSWITPVIREIMADQVAVTHKLKFFENGAVLGPIITAPPGLTISQFQEFVDAAESAHRGAENAYKTLYLAGGTDVTLASANMQQMDFSGLQGKTETRLCVAANMPASIAGVSEGLQGSSLNAGNYGAAKREWADTWLRPTWRSACAALSTIVDEPDDADLWYDECDITFLHEDQQDAATIAQLQMSTIVSAITGGFEPDAAVITVNSAWKDTLKHSGLVSVQLTPPGQGEVPPGGPAEPAGGPTDLPPIPPGFEPNATVRALLAAADMLRATQSQNTGNTGGSGSQTAHEPAGSSKGGQFTANPGGGSSGYKSILPPDSGYKSGGSSKPKAAAAPAAPQNTPQPPATPRTMKVGDSGEDVRYAQYGLSLLGFNVAQDGVYGPETEAAVKQMQERLGVAKPNGHLSASQLRQIQTAVRLSPCIGRSEVDAAQDMFDEIMRAFEDDAEDEESDDEGDIADEDEVDQDEGDAEVVDAVLEALDLAESGEIEVARAHDVSGELRIPGGAGGGRWTKSPVTAAILKALKEAKGPDSFTLDGKPIDREPLRKAAVARGITLKRGASRDDIVKALLDDVGGGEKAAPSAPSPRADAKAKYAAVAQSRPYASAAAAIAELTAKKQSNAVIAEHVRAIAHPDSPDMAEAGNAREVEIENQIRKAYRGAAGVNGGFANIADVRKRLGSDVSPDEVDAALKRMERTRAASLAPQDYGSKRTPADEAAAVKFGGRDNHLVQIADSSPRPVPTAAHDLEQVAAAFEAGNPALGKRRMTAALKKQGITQGPVGTVPFDPAAHEHLGDVPEPGTPVSVVRPGMSLHRGEGDDVQLSKAVVMSAPGKAPAKVAKAAPSVRDELTKAGVEIQPGSMFEHAVDNADVNNPDHLRAMVKRLRSQAQTKESLASMRLGNNPAGSYQSGRGETDLEEARKLMAAADRLEVLAGGPGPKSKPEPDRAALKMAGPRGAVPVAALLDPYSTGSDSSSWKVTGFDGLNKPVPGAAAAVTRYLRDPTFMNKRLRTPGAPLHKQSLGELMGDEPLNVGKAAEAAKTADRQIAAMDRLMEQSRLSRPTTTYRGVRLADMGNPPADAVGHTWTDPGFSSTATRRGVAEHSFGGSASALLTVHVPEGTPALQIGGLGETEVLLGRGQTFRVVADHGKLPNGGRHLEVEVVPKSAPALSNPAAILSSLPADLTPAQRRARLRSRGVSKAEIDALVPLAPKKAAAPRTPLGPGGADDLAEEFYRHPRYTEQQIHDRLAGLNLAELKKVATATNVGLPRDLIKTEAGPVFQPLKKISADDLRKWIAAKIAGDRKLLANEDKFGARSEDLDAEDLIRSEDEPDEEDDEDYDDEPSPLEIEAMAAEEDDEDVERAAGHDVTPGHDQLHHYWTVGAGRARWVDSPKPWTTLLANLVEEIHDKPLETLKRFASRWYIEVFGFSAGSDKARVAHGKPPRGHVVGPG